MDFIDMTQMGQPDMNFDIFNPEYQLTMSKIDEANEALGLEEPVYGKEYTAAFDKQLSALIDSVPLE